MYEALPPVGVQCASIIDEKLYPRCLRYESKEGNLEYSAIETRLREAVELGYFDDPNAVRPVLIPDEVEEATRLYRDARYVHDKRDHFFDDIVRAFLAANAKPPRKEQPQEAPGSTPESEEGTQTKAAILEIESRLLAKLDDMARSITAELGSKMATLEESIEDLKRALRGKGTRESEEQGEVLPKKEVRLFGVSWHHIDRHVIIYHCHVKIVRCHVNVSTCHENISFC